MAANNVWFSFGGITFSATIKGSISIAISGSITRLIPFVSASSVIDIGPDSVVMLTVSADLITGSDI